MTMHEVRYAFLAWCKDRGHAEIPSASLVPLQDPTTLFTGSGMQPLVPYLLGEKHPEGNRICNAQKCFRAEDIDEIGDNRHTTFFEMLGNWSLGDYGKEEQLEMWFSFLVDKIGLDPNRMYATCFLGDTDFDIPRDEESVAVWKRLFADKGIEAGVVEIGSEQDGYEKGMQGGRIFLYDASKNWWSRAGVPKNMPVGEPGGPDSEMFYDFGTPHDPAYGAHCHVNCDCGRFIEIGNSVFMEYIKKDDTTFAPLAQKNVDFGGGLLRITAAVADNPDVFMCEPLATIVRGIEKQSGKAYSDAQYIKSFRVIADHMHAAVFMLTDGVRPSNTGQGYVLRRLIRRSVLHADTLGSGDFSTLARVVGVFYENVYPEILGSAEEIQHIIQEEELKFRDTLAKGLREFEKGERDAFVLFTTYGFPYEMTAELASAQGETLDRSDFDAKMKQHQEASRSATAGAFKGGLQDNSEAVVRLHTAHHLVLSALQNVLGDSVKQRGSNITPDRLRIDFSFDRKMTDEEKQKVTDMINGWIQQDLRVVRREMHKEEAEKIGAEMEFGAKYPDKVSVYFIEDAQGNVISKEFCGGPHVESLGQLGTFAIKKEESSSKGVRRIKGVLIV